MAELTYLLFPFLKVLRTLQYVYGMVRIFFRCNPFQVLHSIIDRIAVLMINVRTERIGWNERGRNKTVDLYRFALPVLMQSHQGIVIAAHFRFGIEGGTQELSRISSADTSETGNNIRLFIALNWFPPLARKIGLKPQSLDAALGAIEKPNGCLMRMVISFGFCVFTGAAKSVKPRRRVGIFTKSFDSNSQGVDLRSGLALVRLAQSLQRLSGPFFILSQEQKLA
jgi:hypothetical protein